MACRLRPSTICTATSLRSISSPIPSSLRFSACSRAGDTRSCSTFATAPGYRVLGTSIDDAAGEAFDKGARLLGLGYPGGAELDRLAQGGDPEAFAFPVAKLDGLDFSFSGVKTALLYAVRDLGDGLETRKADLAASYQRAIVRALVERAQAAAEREQLDTIAVVGGVAANSELRAALPEARFAPLPLCTDNAAMIASAARYGRRLPYPRYLDLDAYASRA